MASSIAVGGCRAPAVRKPVDKADPVIAAGKPFLPGGRGTVAIDPTSSSGALTVTTPDPRTQATTVTASLLSPQETQALIARLEPLPDLAKHNARAPSVRPASAPPPRTGAVQPIAFALPAGKPVGDAPVNPSKLAPRPLDPPQILPVGEIARESEIRVRFAEPMVPVQSVGPPVTIPIAIAPKLAGKWRWIDTRVAEFTAANPRLPQATEVTVTVPAGMKAVSGNTLAAAAIGKFSTPPVELSGTYPETVRPDSPIVIKLDQDVDPAKLAPFLSISGPRKKRIELRTITLAEALPLWKRNPTINFDPNKADELLGKHYVVVAPKTAWPAGTSPQVGLAIGAPSREGPRVTTRESSSMFDVVAPFRARGIYCGEIDTPKLAGARCPAKEFVSVVFENEVAPTSYRANKVQIAGTPFQDNKPDGMNIFLEAPHTVGRTHAITIASDLVDIYGQPLRGPTQLSFVVGPERFGSYVEALTGLYVLDPRFEIPQWLVRAEAVSQVRVQLFKVEPNDYFAFEQFENGKRATPPGKRVHDKTYSVGPKHGAQLRVDLRPALAQQGTGHVIALANATPANQRLTSSKRSAWIQVTRLGLVARSDQDKVSAWVQDISPKSFLAPIPNVATSVVIQGRNDSATASTDASGRVTFDLAKPPPYQPDRRAYLVAHTPTDSTFLAMGSYFEKTTRHHDAYWYVTDDRFTYKPGEKVYVKGWLRWTDNGVNPSMALPIANDPIQWELKDSRGNKIGRGTTQLTDQGGFDLEIALPPNANLGTASLWLIARHGTQQLDHTHPIAIEEFRTPAFAVNLEDDVTHAGATPVVLGESIEMLASARYYAGGGLGGANIEWDASLHATRFSPPGWDTYSFAPLRERGRSPWDERDYDRISVTKAGSLSGASTASVVYGIAGLPGNRPSILSVDANVTDIDRMTIRASSRPILVHPSTYYVGLRLRTGSVTTLEAIVTDIDGNAVPGVPIAIEVEGVLGSERYRADAKVIDTQHCKLASAATPVACDFKRRDDKTAYAARARVADARGRANTTQFDVPWWSYGETQRDLEVVSDKKTYQVGDVAKIEIRSKVVPATAVVSFARQGIIRSKRVELKQASTVVEFPIELGYLQNVFVLVDRIGKRTNQHKASSLPLPEAASAGTELLVDIESARLTMKARAIRPLVEPGENATFEIEVKHADKPKPGAEVALMVVDEAVLALSDKTYVDPLPAFYREVEQGTRGHQTLAMVRDEGPELAGKPGFERYKLDENAHSGSGSGYGVGGGRGGMSGRSTAVPGIVTSRKDFRANAVFSPRLKTDLNGKVRVTVKMPDSLTRFRIVALATSDTRYFGKAEGTIITQRKVNARTVAPRFLTQGDAFSLPVVVQNLDTQPRTVDVAVRAANLVAAGPAGKRVTIPGGQRAEVRFDFTTQARGRAVVQTIATSGAFADASNVEIPVYEPATTESFATYGTVDDAPKFEQLVVPANIFGDVGGVEVELASTQLQSLTDAYWYLQAYPYECAEQRSSRMIATAAMAGILDAFSRGDRPTLAEIEKQRAFDSKRLAKDQLADGGWGYFEGMKSDPYVTMQVLQALTMQKAAPDSRKRAAAFVDKLALEKLGKLEASVKLPAADRPTSGQLDRAEHPYWVSLTAAALATLPPAQARPRAQRLHAAATALASYPVDAKARVLAILARQPQAAAIRGKLVADLLSVVHETASSATVTASYQESERMLLVSNTKTTALALDALMREVPKHPLITKLARGLLDARKGGRWRSTQENQTVLVAMRRYFDTYEKTSPSYTAKLWFGKAAYTEQAFATRGTGRGTGTLDWRTLAPGSTHDLALVKEGPGRLYYRVGITYAPKQTQLPALDAGFVVRRSYTAVDDPADVKREADGRWKIRLGAKVLVTLEALNTTRRHNVAFVDPLPAGFEAVNENLATAERTAPARDDSRWDYRNTRDNRVEAFALELREGSHRMTYTA
ncbi:MAG TPA: alpha-2-macroglobulin family protein, partial [Kofleriaceae bacterium]